MTELERIIEQIKIGQAENIRVVDLGRNQMGDEGVIAFAETLKEANLPHLEWIRLSCSQIGNEGVIAFAEALKGANLLNLKEIILYRNKIGDEGAKAIADALIEANLPQLRWIDLNDNKIGDEGAIAIANSLTEANLPRLEWILLAQNQIGDEGSEAIASALKGANLPHLGLINLIGNKIGGERAMECVAALKTCINNNKKYLAEAEEKAKQELQQDWDSITDKIKQALIDIEYANFLQKEGKLKAAINLYGAALHSFRHFQEAAPEFLNVKQIVKQTAEDMKIAIKDYKAKVGKLKLPVFVLLECFEHLNAKAFERDLLKLFADRGIKSLWDENLASVIFSMVPSKGQPAFFLDAFRKLAATDSKDESDAYTFDIMGEASFCCVS